MRSKLVLFIVLAMCFGFSISQARAELVSWFESFEQGYDDWGSTTNKAYYQIIDTDATDGTHCLNYAPYNGKELYRSIGSSSSFELSWDYKGLEDAGGTYDLNWVQLRNSVSEVRLNFYQRVNPNGSGIELGFWGGVSVTAAADTWVHNKLVVEGETVSWYFNGNLIGSTALVGASGTEITDVRLFNGGTLSEGYIDAMEVAPKVPNKCGDINTEYLIGDVTGPNGIKDCYVDFYDFAELAKSWMDCSDTSNPDCDAFSDAYTLHWGGPVMPFANVGSLELTLGADEKESVEIGVLAHFNLESISLSVTGTSEPNIAELGTQDGISNSGESYSQGQYGIVIDPNAQEVTLEMMTGDHKAFWVVFSSYDLTPGDYSMNIEISPALGPQELIPVTLHVKDVQRAPRSEATVNMYHTATSINVGRDDHYDLMTSHYVSQYQVHFPFNLWGYETVEPNITRDGGGDLVVDFDNFDAQVLTAQNAGLDEIAFMGAYYRDSWFDSLDPAITEAEKKEFGGMLIDHLCDIGFNRPETDPNRIWIYANDELNIADATAQSNIDFLADLKSVSPRLKTHAAINHYTSSMANTLNPVLDVWTMHSRTIEYFMSDLNDATVTIDSNDVIGWYGGCFYYFSPDLSRSMGWKAAWLGVKHYNLFTYNSTTANLDWKLTVDDSTGKPVTTGAFEAARDGFEDYGYWQRLAMVLEVAVANYGSLTSAEQDIVDDAGAFKDLVFNTSESALVKMFMYTEPGRGDPYHKIENPDRWILRSVKAQLLGHIVAVQNVLDVHGL